MFLPKVFLPFLLLGAIAMAEPVARWDFGVEETTKLIPHGGVHRDVPGPRPPEFPDFEPSNLAVRLDGSGAHFAFSEPGNDSPFDFTNGDAITIEAWVNVADLKTGENAYIIGKGRTGDARFARDNQNWALRLREAGGKACASFLFATPPVAGAEKDAHWHRWTSAAGFAPGSGWHHVAASYRFGEPESVRGWIDGQPAGGAWDMGGATRGAPVTDRDAVWIGSSRGGEAANSFRGLLDAIAIHREALPDTAMRTRFRREIAAGRETPPAAESAPAIENIPPGQVLVAFHESLAAHDRWPRPGEATPPEIARWLTGTFLLPRLPLRYDAWGIRDSWKAPVLVRAAADLELPPGRHRFLLRSRGLARLWIDGAVVARTNAHHPSTDGHEHVPPLAEPPVPGARPADYAVQEVFGEAEIAAGGRCRVILESVVGGKKLRPDPGEMCVAVQSADGRVFTLLAPGDAAAPLTEAGWEIAAAKAEAELAALDDTTRRAAAAAQDAFWEKRHALARQWTEKPMNTKLAGNSIDAFLTAKIERAVAASAGGLTPEGKLFHEKVLPVLDENCFRCHGEKEKGDLRLNTREAALKAGTSGEAAIVPGDPAASELIARIRSHDADERMPPKGDGLSVEQIAAIEAWIKAGAPWPAAPVAPEEVATPPAIGDAAFLRRASLDLIGVPPGEKEARDFLADRSPEKRAKLIDRLLADERFADHWVSYWQDVLAENPSILKPSLNNSGPFRWFLHEALRDGKPLDRLVTELVLLRGTQSEGGCAGEGGRGASEARRWEAAAVTRGAVRCSAWFGVAVISDSGLAVES